MLLYFILKTYLIYRGDGNAEKFQILPRYPFKVTYLLKNIYLYTISKSVLSLNSLDTARYVVF